MKLYPPWSLINTEADFFQDELQRELHVSHALHAIKANAIARMEATDDVAYELSDGCIAVVHLTYQKESSDKYPLFSLYDSYSDWYQLAVVNEFYALVGLRNDPSEFAQKLIDLMIGFVSISEFETWVYSSRLLESELGEPLYLELISLSFTDSSVVAEVLNDWFLSKITPRGRDLREIAKSLSPRTV